MYYKTLGEFAMHRIAQNLPVNMQPQMTDISNYRPGTLPSPFQGEENRDEIEYLASMITYLSDQQLMGHSEISDLKMRIEDLENTIGINAGPGMPTRYDQMDTGEWTPESSFSDNGKKPSWWDFDMDEWKARGDEYVQEYQDALAKNSYRIARPAKKSKYRIPKQ